jgi:arylsulfatase A-like enzyme
LGNADLGCGDIHAALDSTGRRENTLIVFYNGNDGITDTHDLETGERKQEDKKSRREKVAAQKVELFNLRDDPSETKDLSAQHPEILKDLRQRYDAYLKAAVKPMQQQLKVK